MAQKKVKFSAADRRKIASLVIGRPSGTVALIGGMEFDLVPLTTRQADRVFELLDTIARLQDEARAAGADEASLTENAFIKLIAKEGKNVRDLVHSVLFKSAQATGLIEGEDGLAVFEEWFDELELKEACVALIPHVVQANGLGTMMGNSLTPPPEPQAEATTGRDDTSRLISVS